MKTLLLLLFSGVISLAAAQVSVSISISPKYGCPNTQHDVTLTATNNGSFGIPSGVSYTIDLVVKTDGGTTIGSFNQTYSNGFAAGATKSYVIPQVDFGGPMVCTVTGSVSVPTFSTTYPVNETYTVQYPPTLTITETSGNLSVTTPLDGYSVQYFVDGDYATVIDESTTGNYTPVADGVYTADGFDPVTGCLSQAHSNGITITVTAVSNTQDISVSVYPNPMTSSVTISSATAEALTYELYNINGALVRTSSFNGTSILNAENLQAGTYTLVVKNQKENVASYKLVK